MNIFDLILWPFKWIVSVVLWLFHTLFTSLGMDPASGLTWVLCIIFLTLVMRTLTIPLFVKQIKAMRGMTAMQGDMAKLQDSGSDADLLRSVPGADGRSHRSAEQ